MKNFEYHPIKLISKKIVLVNGISRTGKLLLGGLVSSFNNTEHFDLGENLEHIFPAIKFGKIDKNYAKSFIHNYLNQLVYNKYISRNINFRSKDRTGVNKSRNPKIYYKRLKINDGDAIVNKIKKDNPVFPLVTHELAANLDIIKKLKLNVKFIEILRDPIDIVYSWYKKGWGKRFGKDQRTFSLLIKKKNKIYPWFSNFNNEKIKKENEVEKCINYILTLTRISIPHLKKNKKTIFITTYESLTKNTKNELIKIAKFLGTNTNKKTLEFIKREKCPIGVDNSTTKKIFFLKKRCSPKRFKEILKLQSYYKKNLYGLR